MKHLPRQRERTSRDKWNPAEGHRHRAAQDPKAGVPLLVPALTELAVPRAQSIRMKKGIERKPVRRGVRNSDLRGRKQQ